VHALYAAVAFGLYPPAQICGRVSVCTYLRGEQETAIITITATEVLVDGTPVPIEEDLLLWFMRQHVQRTDKGWRLTSYTTTFDTQTPGAEGAGGGLPS
jgi:hypothetical protein